MFGGRKFHFRPALAAVSLIAVGVLLSLGIWQLRRLEWKNALVAQVEARVDAPPIPFEAAVLRADAGENMEYAPVELTGLADQNGAALLFGSFDGAAGVYVFTPYSIDSGDAGAGAHVFVNQGFVPQTRAAEVSAAAAPETIIGLFRYAENPRPPASWFQTRGKSVDGLWLVRAPQDFAREAGISASPYYIDRFAAPGREFPKGGLTRIEFRNNHLDYALTWFGLAAALAVVWFASSLKTPRE